MTGRSMMGNKKKKLANQHRTGDNEPGKEMPQQLMMIMDHDDNYTCYIIYSIYLLSQMILLYHMQCISPASLASRGLRHCGRGRAAAATLPQQGRPPPPVPPCSCPLRAPYPIPRLYQPLALGVAQEVGLQGLGPLKAGHGFGCAALLLELYRSLVEDLHLRCMHAPRVSNRGRGGGEGTKRKGRLPLSEQSHDRGGSHWG